MARAEVTLPDGPTDTVSQMAWLSPSSLVAASWDSSVRLYTMEGSPVLRSQYAHKAATLTVAAGSAARVYSGGLDMAVRMHDWTSGTDFVLGSHTDAVKAMAYSQGQRALVTASWDKTMQVWDDRTASSRSQAVSRLPLPDKAYAVSCGGGTDGGQPHLLVAATANRHVCLYDMRKLSSSSTSTSALLSSRESSLKYQTRCVAVHKDGGGWATGSAEGRVGIDFTDDAHAVQEKKYAFKCHRRKLPVQPGAPAPPGAPVEEEVFPVNALAVHPLHGTIASGGGDCTVASWDWLAKKRLAAYTGYTQAVSALAYAPDGSALAIATGYDWSRGEAGAPAHPSASIFVRAVVDAEVRPKAGGGK